MTAARCRPSRTLLLYAQDNQGLGHVTRTLTIARHLLAAYPDTVAYIATKSAVASHFRLPERCDYIKLPTLVAPATFERSPEEEEATKQHFRAIRGQVLRDVALGLAPDLVLVDHEPLGSKGEFREGLWSLKAARPHTRFIFGLRDIMDDAARIRTSWQEMGVYRAFEELYDGIAVYGSARLYDVAAAYAIPSSVHPKLEYCGYIVRDPPAHASAPNTLRARYGLPASGPLVVATVGSGSDGYPVLATARAAVDRLQARHPELAAILVTGPFMGASERAQLEARATATCRVVPEAETFELMATADAVLSMGGYNSVCEALAVGRPLVIVPRATHKIEQQIRAETLASHGLAQCVHPRDAGPETLAAALEWALGRDRKAHARLVRDVIPAFDGATRLTAYLGRWLGD